MTYRVFTQTETGVQVFGSFADDLNCLQRLVLIVGQCRGAGAVLEVEGGALNAMVSGAQ